MPNLCSDEELWDTCHRPGCSEFSPCAHCKAPPAPHVPYPCTVCGHDCAKVNVLIAHHHAIVICPACGYLNDIDTF